MEPLEQMAASPQGAPWASGVCSSRAGPGCTERPASLALGAQSPASVTPPLPQRLKRKVLPATAARLDHQDRPSGRELPRRKGGASPLSPPPGGATPWSRRGLGKLPQPGGSSRGSPCRSGCQAGRGPRAGRVSSTAVIFVPEQRQPRRGPTPTEDTNRDVLRALPGQAREQEAGCRRDLLAPTRGLHV